MFHQTLKTGTWVKIITGRKNPIGQIVQNKLTIGGTRYYLVQLDGKRKWFQYDNVTPITKLERALQ